MKLPTPSHPLRKNTGLFLKSEPGYPFHVVLWFNWVHSGPVSYHGNLYIF